MKVLDRSIPPIAATLPVVRIPRFEQFALSNGLQVVLLEDPRFPSISLRLGLPGGNKFDPVSSTGASEMLAAMMTDGTPSRNAREIAEASALLGAQFHFATSDDFFIGAGTVLEESFEPFLELFAECLLESSIPEDELSLRKQNRLHELVVERSEAGYWADSHLYETVFENHPYAITSPEPGHVSALERAHLQEMKAISLAPAEAVLVLVGDLPERHRLVALLEGTFGQWKSSGETASFLASGRAPQPSVGALPIQVIHRPASVQAELRLGRPAPHRLSDDYLPLSVLNTLLGGGASSRLFMEIREKQGLAYSVASSFSALVDGGILALSTQVAMDRVGDAVRGLHHELGRLLTEAIPEAELRSIHNYMNGTFVLRLESHSSLANQISGIKLLGLGDEYLETYTARVAAVSAGQLQRIATQYFNPKDFAIVVAGDAAVLEPQLAQFGEVKVTEPD